MISCVVLSGGRSHRFGSPKALASVPGPKGAPVQPAIQHIQQTLLQASVTEIIVVLGADAQTIQPYVLKHKAIKTVYNKYHNLGQTSSFQCGLGMVSPDAQGILLWPVDYPFIQTATIQQLIRVFRHKPSPILIPTYKEQKGHPPVFHHHLIPALRRLTPSQGINTLARQHPEMTHFVPVQDPGVRSCFNTPEELKTLVTRLGLLKDN